MDISTITQAIKDYVAQNPEAFEKVAVDIDSIIDEAVKQYDSSVEKIKNEIINDPNPIENPEQVMLKRIKELETEITTDTIAKLETYTKSLE